MKTQEKAITVWTFIKKFKLPRSKTVYKNEKSHLIISYYITIFIEKGINDFRKHIETRKIFGQYNNIFKKQNKIMTHLRTSLQKIKLG